MKQFSVFVVLLFLTAGCTSANGYITANDRPAALADPAFAKAINFNDVDTELLNAAIFHATNEARIKHGRRRIGYEPVLEAAAQRYAIRQAKGRFLAHKDKSNPGYVTPQDRVTKAGAIKPYVAENLATTSGMKIKSGEKIYVIDAKKPILARAPKGRPIARHTYASLARSVVEQWLNSPGHRRNLLSADARALGCGSAYFDQNGIPTFVLIQNFQLYEALKVR